MLFEDLYDSILRRYRASPPKVDPQRQLPRGRLYDLLDATRGVREAQEKKLQEDKVKGKSPSG